MNNLNELCSQIRERVRTKFARVILSASVTPDQLLQEITTIPMTALPAVVVLADSAVFLDGGLTLDTTLAAVVIDRFVPGQEDRIVSGWNSLDALRSLFPAEGLTIGDAAVLPLRFYPVKASQNLSCYVLELSAKQGTEES